MSQQPVKICPRCQVPAALDAGFCSGCGHQFRTRFTNPDQTQMIQAPAQALPPADVYHAASATGGPLDDTERFVSMLWTAVGLCIAGLCVVGGVNALTRHSLTADSLRAAGSLLALLPFAWLLTFLTMRFRRLYLAAPTPASPAEIQARRDRFAFIASLCVGALLLLGAGSAVTEVYVERRKAEAQAHERAAQVEAERLQQADAERKRQESAERQRVLAEEQRMAEEVRRQQMEAENARWATQSGASGALPDTPAVDHGRPPRRTPDAAAPVGEPTAPPTLLSPGERGRASEGVATDPVIMPCGHRFTGFSVRQPGGLGGGSPRHVGVCERGHEFRIENGVWSRL